MFWFTMHESIASLEPPKVPERPSIDQLQKLQKLQNDYKAVKKENIVKVKSFPEHAVTRKKLFKKSNLDFNATNSTKKCDCELEKSFNVNVNQLFSLALNAVNSLNITLKSFDVTSGQIVAIDRFRNTFVLLVSDQANRSSSVKILGYGSILGKHKLDCTSKNLLALIGGKNK